MITVIIILFILWLVATFAISGISYLVISLIGFVTYWEMFIIVGAIVALWFVLGILADRQRGRKDDE